MDAEKNALLKGLVDLSVSTFDLNIHDEYESLVSTSDHDVSRRICRSGCHASQPRLVPCYANCF